MPRASPEAPASSIARNIKAARVEAPGAFGVSGSRQMHETNATRDVTHMMCKFNMGLRMPMEKLVFAVEDGDKTIELPWIRPTTWVKHHLEKYPFLLCGPGAQLEEQLGAFWTCYERVHPGHSVYMHGASRRQRTLPVLLHGDEGRYLKRSNYMICTLECSLGSCPHARAGCDCNTDLVLSLYEGLSDPSATDPDTSQAVRLALQQSANATGNCFLSKFLCFGVASQHYKKYPDLLGKAFELVAEDLAALCTDGVEVPHKGRYFGGFLGVKGDMKFHHQVGHLKRSYFNLGRRRDIPMCHLCMAGAPNVPFESLEDSPPWQSTFCMEPPWDESSVPSLAKIPYDVMCTPKVFALDPFHLWKVGLSRDLLGSGIIALARLGKFDFEAGCSVNLEDRLARAHSCFKMYCLASHKTPALHSFTRNNMMFPNMAAFAWANVKGSDSSLMTKWLLFFIIAQMGPVQVEHRKLVRAITQSLESAVVFWNIMHTHGLWLERKCAQRLQHHLSRMLRAYKRAAFESHALSMSGFGLKPKLHALHHVGEELRVQLRTGAPLVLSPMAYNCESNEDAVGKVCRLSRKLSARLVNQRVFERIMVKTKTLIRKKFPHR